MAPREIIATGITKRTQSGCGRFPRADRYYPILMQTGLCQRFHTPDILSNVPHSHIKNSKYAAEHQVSNFSRNLSASRMNFLNAPRSSMAFLVKRPCLRAFWLPLGAPLPSAPPCMRHRLLPFTAGDRHGLPLRVFAPHRRLESIGPVLRLWCRTILPKSPQVWLSQMSPPPGRSRGPTPTDEVARIIG